MNKLPLFGDGVSAMRHHDGAAAAAQPGDLLRVTGLSIAFGPSDRPIHAVRDLSFSLKAGESLAVVGESGSGKSVTALGVMGLVQAKGGRITQGRVLYRTSCGSDVDLLAMDPHEQRRWRALEAGMVFQEPMTSLNPLIRIGEQISEAARIHKGLTAAAADAHARRMLEMVRVTRAPERLRQYPHELSGGMRQRVMIAMALSCRPRLLIADEPTTALDVQVQAEILALVKDLRQETGSAILFITHDLGVVAETCERVLVMRGGSEVEQGSVADILTRPATPYARMLLRSVPEFGSVRGRYGPARIDVGDDVLPRPAANPAPAGAALPDGAPLLEVRGLSKRYRMRAGLLRQSVDILAVDNISFTLAIGRTLGLVGESGSGKSTTGRCIARLIEPTAGRVLFGGRDVLALSGRQMGAMRRDMQVVFQDPYASLNPSMTGGQLVGEPLVVHGLCRAASERQDRVEALFRKVGLQPEHMKRYPHEFSGGQRQRICIARALSLEPKLILADEPVSALDVTVRAQVMNLMIDLQEELGVSYLFISHDMSVIERMSHTVAVMRAGRIVEMGPRDDVLFDPRHSYTKALLAAVPRLDPNRRSCAVRSVPPGSPGTRQGDPPQRFVFVTPDHRVAEEH